MISPGRGAAGMSSILSKKEVSLSDESTDVLVVLAEPDLGATCELLGFTVVPGVAVGLTGLTPVLLSATLLPTPRSSSIS